MSMAHSARRGIAGSSCGLDAGTVFTFKGFFGSPLAPALFRWQHR